MCRFTFIDVCDIIYDVVEVDIDLVEVKELLNCKMFLAAFVESRLNGKSNQIPSFFLIFLVCCKGLWGSFTSRISLVTHIENIALVGMGTGQPY